VITDSLTAVAPAMVDLLARATDSAAETLAGPAGPTLLLLASLAVLIGLADAVRLAARATLRLRRGRPAAVLPRGLRARSLAAAGADARTIARDTGLPRDLISLLAAPIGSARAEGSPTDASTPGAASATPGAGAAVQIPRAAPRRRLSRVA
jgi:hypothetical protein